MARTTTTYTQGSGQRFMDVLISPDTLKDGTLVQRFNVRKYPHLGQRNTVNTTTALVVTPAGSQPAATVLTLTATVSKSENDDTITGTVAFKNGATTLATTSVNSAGVAATTTTLAAGSHTLTAVYSGDDTYGTSTSAGVARTAS